VDAVAMDVVAAPPTSTDDISCFKSSQPTTIVDKSTPAAREEAAEGAAERTGTTFAVDRQPTRVQDFLSDAPGPSSTGSVSCMEFTSHHELFASARGWDSDNPVVVVGYAFSEKKMSTMGVVMAEASRTKLPWPPVDAAAADPDLVPNSSLPLPSQKMTEPTRDGPMPATGSTSISLSSLSSSISQASRCVDDKFPSPSPILPQHPSEAGMAESSSSSSLRRSLWTGRRSNPHDKVVFSLQSGGYQHFNPAHLRGPATTSGSNDSGPISAASTTPLHHVIRFFRSSCSSINDGNDDGPYYDSGLDNDTDSANSNHSSSTNCHGESTSPAATRFGGAHWGGGGGRPIPPTSFSCPTLVSGTSQRRSSGSSSRSTSTATLYHHRSHFPPSSQMPIRRIAFVPIDLDQPIEEQHGGRMDIILHKLTEDILCLSQLSSSMPLTSSGMSLHECPPIDASDLLISQRSALQRVRNLQDFSMKTGCCLLDDPDRVRNVMQRDTISSVLERCLQGAGSGSGVPVSAPKWTVVESSSSFDRIEQRIVAAGLKYPLIVKPLIAAGTSASHAMAVVSNPTGLVRFVTAARGVDREASNMVGAGVKFLCQEYLNHDEALYKVYVLGSHVSVHRRRSLPNLPPCPTPDEGSRSVPATRLRDVVEFDSQRPYPRLSDFVVPDVEEHGGSCREKHGAHDQDPTPRVDRRKRSRHERDASPCAAPHEGSGQPHASDVQRPASVTVEEVVPVVDAMRRAFGLDLFGFDVLVVSPSSSTAVVKWLVVDVNYFPSYKEVSNFPSLLAKYLTQRALHDRSRAKRVGSLSHPGPESMR
jgi:Inositol 1,3,4-trisphosphate 5/6-kinase ATP-grasp domain/Inositol 1,3,4-trisphosphate 5/6-kinase pre-ATP-grasp domain